MPGAKIARGVPKRVRPRMSSKRWVRTRALPWPATVDAALCDLFCHLLDGRQARDPTRCDLCEGGTGLIESFLENGVANFAAASTGRDEPVALEDGEVLGDALPRDRKRPGERARGSRRRGDASPRHRHECHCDERRVRFAELALACLPPECKQARWLDGLDTSLVRAVSMPDEEHPATGTEVDLGLVAEPAGVTLTYRLPLVR